MKLGAYRLKIGILLTIISGLLMNTSLINFGDFGIPVFYGTTPILLLCYIHHKLRSSKFPYYIPGKSTLAFCLFTIFMLFLVVLVHLIVGIGDPVSEVKQLVARSAFVIFFSVTFLYISQKDYVKISLIYAKNMLKIFIIYGFYQVFADAYHLPLPLNFLRNSASFGFINLTETSNRLDAASGWLSTFRIYSIWAEPSFSALPIGLFLYLVSFHTKNTREIIVWWILGSAYAILTFSRVVWIVEFSVILTILFFVNIKKYIKIQFLIKIINRKKFYLIVFFIILSSFMMVKASQFMQDISSMIRSSSVSVGLKIFFDNPVFGTGMNSFSNEVYSYVSLDSPLILYSSTLIVHSAFISYAQQMGFFGLVYGLLPIFYILSLKNIEIEQRFVIAVIFSVVGVFGGDLYYMPISWLMLAMMGSQNVYNYRTNQKIKTIAKENIN